MKALLKSLFGSRSLSDEQIIDRYGLLLEESESMLRNEKDLPASKEDIKTTIKKRYLEFYSAEEMAALEGGFISLQYFQALKHKPVDMSKIAELSKTNVEDAMRLMRESGPAVEESAQLQAKVAEERRSLHAEWEAFRELVSVELERKAKRSSS